MLQTKDYWAKARKAEDAAVKSGSPDAKNCWRTIAKSYRLLADDREEQENPKNPS